MFCIFEENQGGKELLRLAEQLTKGEKRSRCGPPGNMLS